MLFSAVYCSFLRCLFIFCFSFFSLHSHPVQIVSRWFMCVCAVVIVQLCLCVSFFVSSKSLFTGWCVLYLVKKRARIVKDRAVTLPRTLPPHARHVSFNLLEIFFWKKKVILVLFFFPLESVICLLRVCLWRNMYKDAYMEACEKC